jgi:hypothetical protein
MLAAYFFHSRKSPVENNCSLIKMDWLPACIALRVFGTVHVLVIFRRRWCKICTIIQPMGSNCQYVKKCPKTGRVPYLGLELTMRVIKSQIQLVRQSLFNPLYTVVHQNPELPFFC